MFFFRIVFVSLAFGLFVYLSQQLTRFSVMLLSEKIILISLVAILIGSFAAMPLFFWSERGREFIGKHRWFLNISYYSLPVLSAMMFFVAGRDVLAFVQSVYDLGLPVETLYQGWVSWAIVGLALILLIGGYLNVQRGPQVLRREISDPRLPTSFAGTKILQISDLHISDFVSADFLFKVINRINEEKPDMIVLTGDIVDGDIQRLSAEMAMLKSLKAPLGVYYVPGNHEYYWAGGSIMQQLKEFGIRVLVNEAEGIQQAGGELLVAGVPDPAAKMLGFELPSLKPFKPLFKENQFRILLSHQPALAKSAAQVGFHLQFSGHTHGGQFFPWNLMIGLFHRFSKGYYKHQGMHIYVNQGTAYWGPAVRHGTVCEITVISLVSGQKE